MPYALPHAAGCIRMPGQEQVRGLRSCVSNPRIRHTKSRCSPERRERIAGRRSRMAPAPPEGETQPGSPVHWGRAGIRSRILSHFPSPSFRPEAKEPALSAVEWAAVEKSGPEPAVSSWASRNSRPDRSPCRPEPGAQGHATSMRSEISRLRYRSARNDKPLRHPRHPPAN
jgi:hypothetical protein